MATSGINPFRNENIQQISISQQQHGLNSDGKTRAITFPGEIGGLYSTKKPQGNLKYAEMHAKGILSTVDGIDLLNQYQELIANSGQFQQDSGKKYNLDDNEFHPVYRELIFDEMA